MAIRILTFAFVIFFGISSQAHALLGPDISVGLRFGLSSFSEDDVFGSDVDLASAPLIGAVAGVRGDHLGLELSADWMVTDVESTSDLGELTIIPIMLTGQYHILPKISPADPYLGLGVGFFLTSFDRDSPGDSDVDPAVGFHLNAGVNVMVTTALALNVDARAVFGETDFTFGSAKDEVSLNSFLVTGGLKYFLPN